MQKVTMAKAPDLPLYFGDFGGILIPDSFTPDFCRLANESKAILASQAFETCFDELISELPEPEFRTASVDGRDILAVRSQAQYYMVAGHIVLAKLRGCKYNQLGTGDPKIARFAARACHRLGLSCQITLSRELSEDTALKDELAALGCQVDSDTCRKLYNRPQAYAFQKYLGNRSESSFLPVGANVGAYPFPALSGWFGERFGRRLRESLPTLPDTVAVTMRHGNAAVAVFRGFQNSGGCRLVTVEEPICQEYHGEFCGCSMLFVRPAAPTEYAVTIAPELCDLWRTARAARLGAEDYCEYPAEAGLSAATVRAARIIAKRLPDTQTLLIVEGEYE